jgi:hypothetical protein
MIDLDMIRRALLRGALLAVAFGAGVAVGAALSGTDDPAWTDEHLADWRGEP